VVENAISSGNISINIFDDIEAHVKKLLCLNTIGPFEIWQKEKKAKEALPLQNSYINLPSMYMLVI
jgi:hypothetical protein